MCIDPNPALESQYTPEEAASINALQAMIAAARGQILEIVGRKVLAEPNPDPDPDRIADLEAQLSDGAETLGRERALFVARIEAMRPVVDAACAWADGTDEGGPSDHDLLSVIEKYRASLTPAEVTP
jgi:hypothetical protein